MPTRDKTPNMTAGRLSEQALALAEQMGRIAGALEGTTEHWVNQANVTDSLMKVRDGAAQLLNRVAGAAAAGRRDVKRGPVKPTRRAAASDPAHAPGKRHRKPAPSARGAKHSNERIAKMRTAAAVRQRRKSYAG